MTTEERVDVAVIGAGPAGVVAAVRAARLGARTALVSRDAVGGMAAADGPVPVRTLAQAARLRREARHLHRYGIEMSDAVLDYGQLLDRVRGVVAEVSQHSLLRDELADLGVLLHEHAGTCAVRRPAHHRGRARHPPARRQDHPLCGRHQPGPAGARRGAGGLAPRRVDADRRTGVAAGDRRRGDRCPGRVGVRRARLPA